MRSTHARSSSSERALSSESIGSRCATFSSRPTGSAPTRWVGESGVAQLGVLVLQGAQLSNSASYSASPIDGVVQHVVAVRVLGERATQLGSALGKTAHVNAPAPPTSACLHSRRGEQLVEVEVAQAPPARGDG